MKTDLKFRLRRKKVILFFFCLMFKEAELINLNPI